MFAGQDYLCIKKNVSTTIGNLFVDTIVKYSKNTATPTIDDDDLSVAPTTKEERQRLKDECSKRDLARQDHLRTKAKLLTTNVFFTLSWGIGGCPLHTSHQLTNGLNRAYSLMVKHNDMFPLITIKLNQNDMFYHTDYPPNRFFFAPKY